MAAQSQIVDFSHLNLGAILLAPVRPAGTVACLSLVWSLYYVSKIKLPSQDQPQSRTPADARKHYRYYTSAADGHQYLPQSQQNMFCAGAPASNIGALIIHSIMP